MTADAAIDGLDVYLVGGAVRDELLGYPFHEHDWVVVGTTEEQMLERGFRRVGRDFPVFLHPRTNEEYALARTERKSGRGYSGFFVHASPDVTLEQDLQRRDLTINAIAKSVDGMLIDPFHGVEDIKARQLRHVGDAFVEDPLRVLRIARFYARYAHLGFEVHASTQALMRTITKRNELADLAAERVWKETEKALAEHDPQAYFILLEHVGALAPWFSEFGEPQVMSFALDRLIQVVNAGIIEVDLRWAAMCLVLSSAAQSELIERLHLPVTVQESMSLLKFTFNYLDNTNDAEKIITWCDRVDIWRRSQRCIHLQPLFSVLMPSLGWSTLFHWIEAARRISPRQWIEQGVKGKAIGERLHQARVAVIQECISAS